MKVKKNIVDSYFYNLIDGSPNKRVLREEWTDKKGKRKKSFPQSSWNKTEQRWVPGAEHAIRVPYRSDQINEYAKQCAEANEPWTLVIVEGEKDVHNAQHWFPDQMSIQVTCCCQGAKKGSGADVVCQDAHTRYLKEFNPQTVIVIADRDEPGIDTTKAICSKITEAGYAVEAYLPHPDLGDDGADITDHIDAGYNFEDLELLTWESREKPAEEPTRYEFPNNAGVGSEQYRYFAAALSQSVLYIPGTEDPWHVRVGDSALFEPNMHRVFELGLEVMERRYNEAVDQGVPRGTINRLRSHCTIAAVKSAMEATIASLTVTLDEIAEHKHPYLLNCLNGVVDLRNGALLGEGHDYRFTKVTKVNYDPDADCPKFRKMLEELQPNPEVREWLHRVMGNGATGNMEQVILVFWGRGADGKSPFANVIQHVLGDYAVSSKAAPWLRSRIGTSGDRPRPDKFRLRGARTIFTSETPFDGLLDEVAVKGFVGGDEIVERTLHRKVLPFRGQGLLAFITNNHMRIMDSSLGMRRRMRQVPWLSLIHI